MKSILGSLTLVLVLALAYGTLSLYEASRDKAIAPNEGVLPNVWMQHGSSLNTGTLTCTYGFRIGDNLYGGHGSCPADSTANGALGVPVGLQPDTTATVYYDPNDPSTNSLVEFGAKVAMDYAKARFVFVIAAGCVLLLVIGVVIAGKASQPGGAVMVDTQGTLIYPDQIKSDPDDERFSAHPTHISSEEPD